MDKNQLTYFVSLTQALNFSRVAKQYFISQPALTNQIAKLEAELGVQLFNRSKHGVSLTFAGAEFRQYAVNILNQMMEAESRMNDVSKGAVGFLNISSTAVSTGRTLASLKNAACRTELVLPPRPSSRAMPMASMV